MSRGAIWLASALFVGLASAQAQTAAFPPGLDASASSSFASDTNRTLASPDSSRLVPAIAKDSLVKPAIDSSDLKQLPARALPLRQQMMFAGGFMIFLAIMLTSMQNFNPND